MTDLIDMGCYGMLAGILLMMYANTLVNCLRRHPYELLPV
jgi:hypothetical protein